MFAVNFFQTMQNLHLWKKSKKKCFFLKTIPSLLNESRKLVSSLCITYLIITGILTLAILFSANVPFSHSILNVSKKLLKEILCIYVRLRQDNRMQ